MVANVLGLAQCGIQNRKRLAYCEYSAKIYFHLTTKPHYASPMLTSVGLSWPCLGAWQISTNSFYHSSFFSSVSPHFFSSFFSGPMLQKKLFAIAIHRRLTCQILWGKFIWLINHFFMRKQFFRVGAKLIFLINQTAK